MNILSKSKPRGPLSTSDDKGSVLSVPKRDELDTVNDRVMAVRYCVNYPSGLSTCDDERN